VGIRLRLRRPEASAGRGREGMTEVRRQVRFGVMCTGITFASWEAECLERVVALENTRWHSSSSTSVRRLRRSAGGQSIGCGACCARSACSGSSSALARGW
jgi:hypothetical protein